MSTLMFQTTKRTSDKRSNLYITVIKRLFDIFGASLGIITLLPLFLFCIVLVKLDGTGGPLLSDAPKRVGLNGKQFLMYKFRTMIPEAHEHFDTEPKYKKLRKLKEDNGGKLKIDEDPRITKIGKFLRKWDLDELPQLFNVVRGDMSMVGPRPYFEDEIEMYSEKNPSGENHFETVMSVLPGITGLWQVSGRNELPFDRRVEMDCSYAQNISFINDLKIIIKTPYVVLFRIGAW